MQQATQPGLLKRNADLARHNTLALPGYAALYAYITASGQLESLRSSLAVAKSPRFVLGGGSNLVLTGDYDGLVLHIAIAGRALLGEDADAWYVRAGAGENWHDFVQWTLAQGWPGLENLSLIPGTVGASPIQNIGAYGLEVAERFHCLDGFDMQTGETTHFDLAACRFGYRDSVFKQEGWHRDGRIVVTGVTFRLAKQWQPLSRYADIALELDTQKIAAPSAQDIANAVIAIRQRKLPDPAPIPTAGSFFHNPVVDAATVQALLTKHPNMPHYPHADGRCKLAAGWLIEQVGWKGKNLGPVGMYEKQALVLVNRGGAKGSDVTALMQAVTRDVRETYGVVLTPEPIFI